MRNFLIICKYIFKVINELNNIRQYDISTALWGCAYTLVVYAQEIGRFENLEPLADKLNQNKPFEIKDPSKFIEKFIDFVTFVESASCKQYIGTHAYRELSRSLSDKWPLKHLIIPIGNTTVHACAKASIALQGLMINMIETLTFDDPKLKTTQNQALKAMGQIKAQTATETATTTITTTKPTTLTNMPKQDNTMNTITISGYTGRTIAINLCIKNGYPIKDTKQFTLASLNTTKRDYWANPKPEILNQDWWLVLNDNLKKELHVFCIPANSIKPGVYGSRVPGKIGLRLHPQKINAYRMDIQILYQDQFFEILNGDIKLLPYYQGTIRY